MKHIKTELVILCIFIGLVLLAIFSEIDTTKPIELLISGFIGYIARD